MAAETRTGTKPGDHLGGLHWSPGCWLSDETSGIMIRALCDNSTLHSHRLLAIPSRGHLSTLGCEDEQKERVNSALRRHFSEASARIEHSGVGRLCGIVASVNNAHSDIDVPAVDGAAVAALFEGEIVRDDDGFVSSRSSRAGQGREGNEVVGEGGCEPSGRAERRRGREGVVPVDPVALWADQGEVE